MTTRDAAVRAAPGAAVPTAVGDRRDDKRRRREAQLADRARADAARRRQRVLMIAGGAVVVLAALGALAWWLFGSSDSGVQTFPIQGRQHVEHTATHPPYNSVPPTSGWHWGDSVAPPGISTQPIVNEVQVHNLEHGEIMVQYDCPTACLDIVSKLEAIVRTYPKKVVLAPYPGIAETGHPIALTAWGRVAYLNSVDEGFIRNFITKYKDKAPEYFPD